MVYSLRWLHSSSFYCQRNSLHLYRRLLPLECDRALNMFDKMPSSGSKRFLFFYFNEFRRTQEAVRDLRLLRGCGRSSFSLYPTPLSCFPARLLLRLHHRNRIKPLVASGFDAVEDAILRCENYLHNQRTHFFFNSTPPPSPASSGIFNMDASDYSSATDIDVDRDNNPQKTSFSYPSSPRAAADADAAFTLPCTDILPVSTGRMRRRSIIAKGVQKTLSKTSMLVNFLPTGTLLTFEMLLPSASGDGTCSPVSTAMIYILLAISALSCFFFHFTDSFRAPNGKVYYGFVTPTGLALFKSGNLGADAEIEVPRDDRYVMRFVDLIHAGMSVLVFAAIALSDHRVTNCVIPGHRKEMDEFMDSFPLMVGAVCSGLFLVFPNTRYGIGCMAA